VTGRVHVFLVPGFAGFDALGQLEYYAGITPLFRDWAAARGRGPRCALHYFDNLPTAAVETRATRLRAHLARRLARGLIQPGDEVALVGHSTGGLDIRRLIWDLAHQREPITVDGPRGAALAVEPAALLALVRRVVFLSVPQHGTNLADWVRAHPIERALAVTGLRAIVRAAAGVPAADLFQAWVAGQAAALAGADLLLALQDALGEIDVAPGDDPARVAGAHEAAAQLGLWLRHLSADFRAIDDLAATPTPRSRSPAHFTAAARDEERALWRAGGIATRSYATLGSRVFRFEPGKPAPRWDRAKPWTWPDFSPEGARADGTDLVYRYAYRACAGGPLRHPGGAAPVATPLGGGAPEQIELWDSDGVVNTTSMFWPDGGDTLLVRADHGDVIGHYRAAPAREGSKRRHHAYDLLGSASGFDAAALRRVWEGVFEFCAGGG
jgi:hypothetical protein